MALAIDNYEFLDTGTTLGVGVSSATYSYVNAGNFLMVPIFTNTGDFLSSVTYDGVPMTIIKQQEGSAASYIYLAYLFNPSIGLKNVVVNLSASNKYIEVGVLSLKNADTSGLDSSNFAGNTSTSITCGVTTIKDNSWVLGIGRSDTGTESAGSNTTKLVGVAASSGLQIYEFSSNPITSAGLTTIGMNNSASNNNGFITISVAPATNTTTSTSTSTTSTSTTTTSTSTSTTTTSTSTTSTSTTTTSTSTSTTSTSTTTTSTTTTMPYFFTIDAGE